MSLRVTLLSPFSAASSAVLIIICSRRLLCASRLVFQVYASTCKAAITADFIYKGQPCACPASRPLPVNCQPAVYFDAAKLRQGGPYHIRSYTSRYSEN